MKGSRARCLELTGRPDAVVAQLLTDLIQPFGAVNANSDFWMPRGPNNGREAKLGECESFVTDHAMRKTLTDWWLEIVPHANTPNWDIVSTCMIDGQAGLMLVEAKAHVHELDTAGKRCDLHASPNSKANHNRIADAIEQANVGLKAVMPGWNLSRDNHYQMCNRFAWSWKLASMGIPVVLVYLGFLKADEMQIGRTLFGSHLNWESFVRSYGNGIVPDAAWNGCIDVNRTPMYAVIRSLDLPIP